MVTGAPATYLIVVDGLHGKPGHVRALHDVEPDVARVVAVDPFPRDGEATGAEVCELREAVGEEVDVGGGRGTAAALVDDLDIGSVCWFCDAFGRSVSRWQQGHSVSVHVVAGGRENTC